MKKLTFIFSITLTLTVFAQVPSYVPTNGLAAWYSFSGNANDESGGNNNGTVNGATLTTGKLGDPNSAYLFNGTSNTIQLANPFLNGNQNTAFTFHALVNSNSTSSNQVIWSKTLFWGEISFGISNLNEVKFGWANSETGNKYSTIYSQPNVIQPNQWYDIVVTFENSVGQIYLNGVAVATNLQWMAQGGSVLSTSQIETSCNFAQDANSSKIGTYLNASHFNGKIDEFGVWSRALSLTEIEQLFNTCNNIVTIQPTDQTLNLSAITTVQFSTTSSATTASYQWQTNIGLGFQNLSDAGQYSGSTTNTLSVDNVTIANHNQQFRCIVADGSCEDTTDVAVLTVIDDLGIDDVKPNGSKKLLKITDLNGKETPFRKNTIMLFIYEDGTVERVYEGE